MIGKQAAKLIHINTCAHSSIGASVSVSTAPAMAVILRGKLSKQWTTATKFGNARNVSTSARIWSHNGEKRSQIEPAINMPNTWNIYNFNIASNGIIARRFKTTTSKEANEPNNGVTEGTGEDTVNDSPGQPTEARLLIGFTCKVCKHRQFKTMSKNAYEKGVVIMQCDGCKNRHLISDNMGWFRDKNVNIEDIMQENGESVRQLRDAGLLDNIESEGVKDALNTYSDILKRRNEDQNQNQTQSPDQKKD